MAPAFPEGRIVVATSHYRRLAVGDVVVVSHQGMEKIKRIHDITRGRVFLLGDNPHASTDGRTFGWLPRSSIIGKVVGRRLTQKRHSLPSSVVE